MKDEIEKRDKRPVWCDECGTTYEQSDIDEGRIKIYRIKNRNICEICIEEENK